jgi:hypothetical protein
MGDSRHSLGVHVVGALSQPENSPAPSLHPPTDPRCVV